jgi:hypothetical protein
VQFDTQNAGAKRIVTTLKLAREARIARMEARVGIEPAYAALQAAA